MYMWRQMTDRQRAEILQLRRQHCSPWHSPPHWESTTRRYHVIAACYEHAPIIGITPQRLLEFQQVFLDTITPLTTHLHAWVVLPNHYHALVTTPNILAFLVALGRLHGRTSHAWNGEDGRRGRQVWCKAAETGMKSERHFWATMNYVHNNPVRHNYVTRWQDWPFGSAGAYLDTVGTEAAKRCWLQYPVGDYGKDWDPAEK
jgi:putative transposase